jgi:3-oxoacyl-[acyl-carrier protein] reductase
MFDLAERTALVTGATGGIGAAIAQALHRQGATVAISGRRHDALESLAAAMADRVHVLPCDLTDTTQIGALVAQAEETMGRLDILVVNAGILKGNLLAQMSDEEWNTVIGLDLTAAFQLARAALRGMIRRRFGRLIGITSMLAVTGFPGQANYAAAKAGMIGLFKTMAQEYAKRGITANCIAPGFIVPAMAGVRIGEEQRDAIIARVPAARLGSVDDVAAAAVFLASNEAAYVIGQTLHVNGGLVMA